MRNIYFTREPACTYDIMFLFELYFNKDYCLNNFINFQKAAQDTEFYETLLFELGDVPEELRLFFHIRKDGKCFMIQMYFDRYEAILNTSYSLGTVQEALLNIPELTEQILEFYFPERKEQREPTLTQLSAWIRKSSYDAAVKSSLYAFFIEPVLMAQMLSRELTDKAEVVARRAQKGPVFYRDLEKQFDLEALEELLRDCKKQQECHLDFFDNVDISFALLNKNNVNIIFYEQRALLILGYDYLDRMRELCSRVQLPTLDVFCDALAEKNRLRILDYMVEHEEATIQDLERAMGLSGTNAYYHLTILIKANVVRTRNQGRLVIYSLNREYFDTVGTLLHKYQSKGE